MKENTPTGAPQPQVQARPETGADPEALLERIRTARRERRTIRNGDSSVELEDAYRIQAALGTCEELKGYKLALASLSATEPTTLDDNIHGRVYASALLESPIGLSRFLQPRLAASLAVVLDRDIAAGAEPDAALLAAGGAFLALEILDSVWEGFAFNAAGVAADNASVGGLMLGEHLLDRAVGGTLALYLGGTLVWELPVEATEALGPSLAWLAGRVGGLSAGQIVVLGVATSSVVARPATLELRGAGGETLVARIEE